MSNHKKFIIHRIVNNNVIVSKDAKNEEIVLMGSGIAFKRKTGEFILQECVEKMFVLKGNDKNRYFDIVENIPVLYFDIAMKILEDAQRNLDIKISSIGCIMLADHIFSAVDRIKEGIVLKNEMLEEIKCFYPKEFHIGKDSLNYIFYKTKVRLPIDEAGFIAYHIINLSAKTIQKNDKKRIELTNKIIEIVESYFNLSLNRESAYFDRFLTHLKFFSQRIFSGENIDIKKDDFLYRMLKVQYPDTTKCVNIIKEFVEYNYHAHISDEERGYLIVHINNLLQKMR